MFIILSYGPEKRPWRGPKWPKKRQKKSKIPKYSKCKSNMRFEIQIFSFYSYRLEKSPWRGPKWGQKRSNLYKLQSMSIWVSNHILIQRGIRICIWRYKYVHSVLIGLKIAPRGAQKRVGKKCKISICSKVCQYGCQIISTFNKK